MGINKDAPLWNVPMVDPRTGILDQAWHGYLTQLSGSPAAIVTVTPTSSPFSYKIPLNGTLALSGGTVSGVTLARARVSGVPLGLTGGCVTLAAGDVVTITYSVLPTINFIPT